SERISLSPRLARWLLKSASTVIGISVFIPTPCRLPDDFRSMCKRSDAISFRYQLTRSTRRKEPVRFSFVAAFAWRLSRSVAIRSVKDAQELNQSRTSSRLARLQNLLKRNWISETITHDVCAIDLKLKLTIAFPTSSSTATTNNACRTFRISRFVSLKAKAC